MKKKEFLLIAFIFIAVFSMIIIKPISNLDEIWNYNTARAISEGLTPYKDISMITTPFLPMITAIFLKIIANEVIVSRILASILWTGILFTTYKILKKLIREENICLILTSLIGIICRAVVSFSCYSLNVTIGLSLSAQVAIPVFVFSLIWMPKIFLSSVYFRTGFPAKSNT